MRRIAKPWSRSDFLHTLWMATKLARYQLWYEPSLWKEGISIWTADSIRKSNSKTKMSHIVLLRLVAQNALCWRNISLRGDHLYESYHWKSSLGVFTARNAQKHCASAQDPRVWNTEMLHGGASSRSKSWKSENHENHENHEKWYANIARHAKNRVQREKSCRTISESMKSLNFMKIVKLSKIRLFYRSDRETLLPFGLSS